MKIILPDASARGAICKDIVFTCKLRLTERTYGRVWANLLFLNSMKSKEKLLALFKLTPVALFGRNMARLAY